MTESSHINPSRANENFQTGAHQTPTRLVLIDGNAILHRAYHALPPLTTPDGKLVNAVYGFTTILLRLITDLAPTHLAVCFDRPAPTFRKELFTGYQAKRPKMDDELIPQVEGVHEVVRACGVPLFEMDGFEADDIIGTIVHDVIDKHQIDQIIIVTGDKDLLQLVEDEKVLVYMPTKGLSEGKLYGEKETKERLGVVPSLVPDYKALAGDSSDNYSGIPGIGPKTAVEILQKAGSVEELYKYIETKTFGLSDTLVEKIKQGKENSLLSHQLATIKCDVPIAIAIQEFSEDQLRTPEVIELLQTLGFYSLIKRLQKSDTVKSRETKKLKDKEKQNDESKQLALV